MKTGYWSIAVALTLAHAAFPDTRADYVDARLCAACHSKIYETYRRTGMARSYSRPTVENEIEDYRRKNSFYHRASDTYFTMAERNGRYFQRRYQIGFEGKETNVDEHAIDFIIGSGDHVRSYLFRTPNGALQELPLAWYSEKGGYWGMNPGYDKPDQPNARRKINYECMSCHNSYPDIPAGHDQLQAAPLYTGALPEGIDCQRCHGPGRRHIEVAHTAGAAAQAIRAAIVNPARLSPARRMEVCLQCHLETTSFPFTHSIAKYDRGSFSYQPGEPLEDFILFFDHAPSNPKEDRFQIVNSAYRLRMSACFLKSEGALQCTTCHDPHDVPGPAEAARHFNSVCRDCHKTVGVNHTTNPDCIDCHMPRRRTADVVHAVMTDHYIQRRKPAGDLLAEIPEINGPATFYHGAALPYYPRPFPATPESELYLSVAQVQTNNDPDRGIPRLTAAIRKYQPKRPEFYIELGDALRNNGKAGDAIPVYEQAVRLKSDSLAALLGLGQALDVTGQPAKALDAFRRATEAAPDDAFSWQQLGQSRLKLGDKTQAVTTLRKSITLDPAVPEAHYALAMAGSDPEASWREAIRLQPDYSEAHLNLAIFLAQRNQTAEAIYHFQYALRIRPDYALAHLNYGLLLKSLGRMKEAEQHLKKSR